MIRSLLALAVIALVGLALLPDLVQTLTWVLAFLSLLILGDLIVSAARKLRNRPR